LLEGGAEPVGSGLNGSEVRTEVDARSGEARQRGKCLTEFVGVTKKCPCEMGQPTERLTFSDGDNLGTVLHQRMCYRPDEWATARKKHAFAGDGHAGFNERL
jgi:hypothetical protein